ncbi:hypothetical protein QR680_014311 [Steinernema hermaphroditum]|uniref:Uncharacterized protein n=1 Tax=Steinernema hermaphroditum TaxID=289476 RepID=A0AA39IB60_9BILA|nr:hypothetical protein QR680_014311 [Steinernema hermaphroditum]
MDIVPLAFYEHLFPTLRRTRVYNIAELSGSVGHFAEQYSKKKNYFVHAYISDNFYATVEMVHGGPCEKGTLSEFASLWNEAAHIVIFTVHVFENFLPKIPKNFRLENDQENNDDKQDAYRSKFMVSKDAFSKLMKLFVYSPFRRIVFFGSNADYRPDSHVTISEAHISNFKVFKKYLRVGHCIECDFGDYRLSNYHDLIPEFFRNPSMKELRLDNGNCWSESTMEAIFDFLKSPHSERLTYSQWIGSEPTNFIAKWMDLDENIPSDKTILFSNNENLMFLKKFVVNEISRESVRELSKCMDSQVERMPIGSHRFFKLQHPKLRQHYLIVLIYVPHQERTNIQLATVEEALAMCECCMYYFI